MRIRTHCLRVSSEIQTLVRTNAYMQFTQHMYVHMYSVTRLIYPRFIGQIYGNMCTYVHSPSVFSEKVLVQQFNSFMQDMCSVSHIRIYVRICYFLSSFMCIGTASSLPVHTCMYVVVSPYVLLDSKNISLS